MIKDKHSVRQPHQPAPVQESLPEEVSENPFVNMYQAVKRAIQTIREIRTIRSHLPFSRL